MLQSNQFNAAEAAATTTRISAKAKLVFVLLLLVSIIHPFAYSMRIVVQRVTSASVLVDGKIISSIGVSIARYRRCTTLCTWLHCAVWTQK